MFQHLLCGKAQQSCKLRSTHSNFSLALVTATVAAWATRARGVQHSSVKVASSSAHTIRNILSSTTTPFRTDKLLVNQYQALGVSQCPFWGVFLTPAITFFLASRRRVFNWNWYYIGKWTDGSVLDFSPGPAKLPFTSYVGLNWFNVMASFLALSFNCWLFVVLLEESVLKYPDIFCGSSEHMTMRVFGIFLITLAVTFLVLCCFAAVRAPGWSHTEILGRAVQWFQWGIMTIIVC